MKPDYVLRLAKLCLILLEIPPVFPVIPICMTWNTTINYLIVECSVLFATQNIFIVDQFGIIRGQCITAESWSCSRTHTHDLSFRKTLNNLTKLTLTINRDTAEGEWKCRHGNDTRTVNVSYIKGDFPIIDIEVTKDTREINKSNIFKLTCSSCKEPDTKGVDISINEVIEDSIRYESGLCYHKRRVCTQDSCSCLAGGNQYTWTLISNLSYIQFTCTMRFRDAMNSTILITKAHVIYNGSVMIQKQKENESIKYPDKTPDDTGVDTGKTNKSGTVGYAVAGTVCLIILIIISIFGRFIYIKRKQKAHHDDRKNLHETIPLQNIQEPLLNKDTDTNLSLFLSLRNTMNTVFKDERRGKMIILSTEYLEQFGFNIIKGWGVEVEQTRLSFHMNKLQSLGPCYHDCLYNVTACLVRDKSFKFLRLYDVTKFSLSELKLNKNVYNLITKIFQMIMDRKSEKWWYHYRRNGLTCEGSSEDAFIYVKQIFLSTKHSVQYPMFSTYESRLDTFHDYPIENKSCRERLAFAGFFSVGVSDYVQCYACGGCLRDWKYIIDPMMRHRETFPTCNVAMNSESKRHSIMNAETETERSQQTYEDRLDSFKSFPETLSEDDMQRLSVAGFYYCGIAEDIVCCACNVGFSIIDNSDHILQLHQQYSPDCKFINMCDNKPQGLDILDKENVSFSQYLELEYRSHDFRFQNI